MISINICCVYNLLEVKDLGIEIVMSILEVSLVGVLLWIYVIFLGLRIRNFCMM